MTDQPRPSLDAHRRRRWVAAAVLLALGGAVAGAVYGIGSIGRNPGAAACRPAVELAQRIAPLVRGEVAALAVAEVQSAMQRSWDSGHWEDVRSLRLD